MSYYQGDYYQGDYYQGDPFLGALIGAGATWLGKKLLGRGAARAAIAPVGAAALVGTGTGMVVGGVGTEIARLGANTLWSRMRGAAPRFGLGIGSQYQPPRLPQSLQRGPSTQTLVMTGTAGGACSCPSGYHPNKTTTKMGHPPGTTCVKNRSMNVANPRALRRSLRRVAGFGKLANRARKTVNATARAMK